MKYITDLMAIMNEVSLPGHEFHAGHYTDLHGKAVDAWYIQDTYIRRDSVTGMVERGFGRKWHVSCHATVSEVVLTMLKAAITDAEHEVREEFSYKGKHIFQPHIDVQALVRACDDSDARLVPAGTTEVARGEILG